MAWSAKTCSVTVCVTVAFTVTVGMMPASAAESVKENVQSSIVSGDKSPSPLSPYDKVLSIGNQPAVDGKQHMPDNPSQPLPKSINDSIPQDSVILSKDLALTPDSQVKNVISGKTVTDSRIVGTKDKPADPLTKTDGKSFMPVTIKQVRQSLEQSQSTKTKSSDFSQTETSGQHRVKAASLPNNDYGAYWGSYNGTQAFFENGGNLFAQQAKGVVDVSQWQGNIDWQAAKNSGVEGAIIRISYGWGNGYDSYAVRNINECKRLGIPFGVYLYSYAYDSATGAEEGKDVVNLLRRAGVSPSDLSYPVFYDLEAWSWTGHSHPTSPGVYDGIVNSWYGQLQSAGYSNLSVYSYTFYLDTALDSGNIHGKTRWVASYGPRTNFSYQTNNRGWQYTSGGNISGINGSVDLNAFGNHDYSSQTQITDYPIVKIPNGDYFISSSKKDTSGFDVPGASTQEALRLQLYSANRTAAQQYQFNRQSDGSYTIRSDASGKMLDVVNGYAYGGAAVQQYTSNGTQAQRWWLRDTGQGGLYLQSALGNWVIDLPSANTGNGTKLQLWEPNLSQAQQYLLSTTQTISTHKGVRIVSGLNSGQVLDIPGGSPDNGARVQSYSWNGTDSQIFAFSEVGNGLYEIVNANSGKAIESAGADTGNGARVQQYAVNHTAAQRWMLRSQGSGYYSLFNECTNKALDLPGGQSRNGTGLQLYTGNDTSSQQWKMVPSQSAREKLDALAKEHKKDLADGTYQFGSANNTALKLDVAGGSHDDGTQVRLFTGNGTGAQSWQVKHDSRGYITLVNIGSGKALDVAWGLKVPGTIVQQYSSNGTWSQRWIAIKDGNSFKLVSALDKGLALDVANASKANGARVQIYSDNETPAQRWKIDKQ